MLGNLSVHLVVRLVASGLQALSLVLLARVLGAREFGLLVSLLAIGAVIGVLTGFGGTSHALRVLASSEPKRLAATMMRMRALSLVGVAPVVCGLGYYLFGFEAVQSFAIAGFVAAEADSQLSRSIAVGFQRLRMANILALCRPMAMLLGILVSLGFSVSTIAGYCAGAFISACVARLSVSALVGRSGQVRPVLRASYGYWWSTSLVSLQQLDVPLVGGISSVDLAGNYAGVNRLVNPVNLAASAVLAIFTPELSKSTELNEKDRVFREAFRIVLRGALALVLLSPVAAIVGPILLGPDFEDSGPLFVGLTMGVAVNAFSQLYAGWYYAFGRAGLLSWVRMVTIPTSLGVIATAAWSGNMWILAVGVVVARLVEMLVLILCMPRGVRKSGEDAD